MRTVGDGLAQLRVWKAPYIVRRRRQQMTRFAASKNLLLGELKQRL